MVRVLAVFCSITAAQARTISFIDANGVLSGASSFAGDIVFCSAQPCTVAETYNPAFESVTSGIVPTLYFANKNGFVLDKLVTSNSNPGFVDYALTFLGGGVTCASVGGCQFTANGAVQTVETVNFSGEPPTAVTFQAVPEPSTALLLVLGWAMLVLLKQKTVGTGSISRNSRR